LPVYGFLRRKKPAPLDGSMGLVMNVESLALITYNIGADPFDVVS
jgi:hypothetical protein